MSKEKILVSDEKNLGHSYYIDSGDGYYYDYYSGTVYDSWNDYDYDDYDIYSGDGYYYDSYSGTINDSWNDDYYDDYYYPDNDYYYGSYYYPYYYNTRYYYDDYYRSRRYSRYGLYLDGSTVIVGSEYDNDVWLDDDYKNARALDASRNDRNLRLGGNDRNNTIISGNGQTTLYGNGGTSNTLIGGSGKNCFFFNGKYDDVALNFETGDRANSDIIVFSNNTYSAINRDSGNIIFTAPNGNRMQLRTNNVSEQDPVWVYWENTALHKYMIAFDTSNQMNYRDDVQTFYFNRPAQINVSGENHNVRIDGSGGQNFANVNTINAAASYGYNTLIGNAGANVIIGGSGTSSLWGNNDNAADTLIGGSGAETFFTGRFVGNDVIFTDDAQDLIYLYDTNLSDITYVNVDAGQVVAGFNTGSQMIVRNSANVTSIFQLADGSRYNYHRDSGQWTNP